MSIFQTIKRYFKRKRMRRSLKVRAYAGRPGISRFHASPLLPIIKFVVVIVIIAAIGAGIYFYAIPFVKTLANNSMPEPTPTPIPTPTPAPPTYAKADMSYLEEELLIPHWFISDPYYFSGKVVYTSGQIAATAPPSVFQVIVFDVASKNTEEIPMPPKINSETNIFEAQMNEYWIVWLEVHPQGGGRIWAYDRMNTKSFIIREFNYGMPKIHLSDNYMMFMVSTGAKSDKLYLYDLAAQEALILRSYYYSDESFSISSPAICETEMLWIDSINEEEGTTTLQAHMIKEGLSFEKDPYVINSYVFEPKTNGEVIVFLDTQRSLNGNLMLFDPSSGSNDPIKVATGVMNYDLGDTFVAYTKDEAVYVYFWADGSTGRISNMNSRSLLARVTDDVVLFNDQTDGMIGSDDKARDVIKMAKIPFEK